MEETFRDEQFRSGGSPAREGVMDAANAEVNAVWRQAVRLSLLRSVNSARLIVSNDRSLNDQKKEQLILVGRLDAVDRADPGGAEVLRE